MYRVTCVREVSMTSALKIKTARRGWPGHRKSTRLIRRLIDPARRERPGGPEPSLARAVPARRVHCRADNAATQPETAPWTISSPTSVLPPALLEHSLRAATPTACGEPVHALIGWAPPYPSTPRPERTRHQPAARPAGRARPARG